MITEVSFTVPPEKEKDESFIGRQILYALAKKNIGIPQGKEYSTHFVKKSIDARHGRPRLFMRYRVFIGEAAHDAAALPCWKKASGSHSVLIVGSGPAGLFAALKLLEYGIKPVIIERGACTYARKRDIAAISTRGTVDSDSNYCFGEGGAGTFSDGKLYTRSNKRGNIPQILSIFAHFGADPKICTDAHPHIGTDKLPAIVSAISAFIVQQGGEIHFNTRCTDFITELPQADGIKTIRGIRAVDTATGEQKDFFADAVLLATGHSASDIYSIIARHAPLALEAKTFAVGVRVEHPRSEIDFMQYHGRPGSENLGAAEYRFTTQQEGRGVYSFCMCPGGFVVPSSTESGAMVVNGMSSAGRNSRWSNAAVVVETRPEDIPQEFQKQAQETGCPALAGLLWRTNLERLTAQHGTGQKAPAQMMADFMHKKESAELTATSYAPGVVPSALHLWLPERISKRLSLCFAEVNSRMKGYISPNALLIASETRTSTPVRILRQKENEPCPGQSPALKWLYPAGEGSGYAGGIVSSAMDGERSATLIARALQHGI